MVLQLVRGADAQGAARATAATVQVGAGLPRVPRRQRAPPRGVRLSRRAAPWSENSVTACRSTRRRATPPARAPPAQPRHRLRAPLLGCVRALRRGLQHGGGQQRARVEGQVSFSSSGMFHIDKNSVRRLQPRGTLLATVGCGVPQRRYAFPFVHGGRGVRRSSRVFIGRCGRSQGGVAPARLLEDALRGGGWLFNDLAQVWHDALTRSPP